MAFHALADYQNHVIGWLQWEQSSLGDGAVVRFPRIWMSSGECRLNTLDLGCGSGLAGVSLRPLSSRMVGIDLSPEMIELARAREIYDQLAVAEITDWLDQTDEQFDIIAACDCLIYFGDLHQIVAAAAKRVSSDGALALSMERSDHYPFRLMDSGRYAHHPDHVREVASAAGLKLAHLDEAFLQTEYDNEVTGLFAILN